LNGELTIDFPEDVKIPVEPNQMVTASISGSSLKFSYCELGNAIAQCQAKPDRIFEGTVCGGDSGDENSKIDRICIHF
jgi:hypothetical protein